MGRVTRFLNFAWDWDITVKITSFSTFKNATQTRLLLKSMSRQDAYTWRAASNIWEFPDVIKLNDDRKQACVEMASWADWHDTRRGHHKVNSFQGNTWCQTPFVVRHGGGRPSAGWEVSSRQHGDTLTCICNLYMPGAMQVTLWPCDLWPWEKWSSINSHKDTTRHTVSRDWPKHTYSWDCVLAKVPECVSTLTCRGNVLHRYW